MAKQPPKATIEKAVKAAQVYCGSVGRVRLADEQKLYKRMQHAVERVVKASQGGIELWNAEKQIRDEARRRGCRLALPGQDI